MGSRTFFRMFTRRKKAKIESQSRTPILDLLEPLPKPHDEIFTGKFAFPLLTATALVGIGGNLSFLLVLFGFVLILFLVIAVHELGHLVAGWWVGFRFYGVDLGPLSIKRIRRKWGIRIVPRFYRGAAYMSVDRLRRIRHREAICLMGGPAASYLCGLGAFIAGEVLRGRSDSGWAAFLSFFGFLSFLIGVLSTVPFRTVQGGNDAFLLRHLLYSKEISTQTIASHALLYVHLVKPERPTYHDRWWNLLQDDIRTPARSYHSDWSAYANAKDELVAAECLERLLRSSGTMPEELRESLAAESVVFTGWRRSNVQQAEAWFRRIKHYDWFGPMQRLRVEVAMCSAKNQSQEALKRCEAAIAILVANQNGQEFDRAKAEWINWRDLIQQKIANAAPSAEAAAQPIDV